MHLLPAGGFPKPHSAFLNHEGKGLVEAERNEMKINMAAQRLRPRTRYQSPRWKTHRKLRQIIVWNFWEWERERKNRCSKRKKGQLIYISINCACVAAGFGDLCVCLLSVLVCVQLSTCKIIHEWVSVCACACLTSLWFSDHMILYISCSIGCWTASTAHNNVKICSIWIPLPAVSVWLLMQPKLHTFVKNMSFDWYWSGANNNNNNKQLYKKCTCWNEQCQGIYRWPHRWEHSVMNQFCKLNHCIVIQFCEPNCVRCSVDRHQQLWIGSVLKLEVKSSAAKASVVSKRLLLRSGCFWMEQ